MRNVCEKQKKSIKILCIDDETHVLNALKRTLRSDLFEIYTATDLDEAFDYYTQEKPEIVITDFQMPGLNGVQLLKEFKTEFSEACWIVLSGYAKSNEIQNLLQTGELFCFLSKPWSEKELRAAVLKASRSKKRGR